MVRDYDTYFGDLCSEPDRTRVEPHAWQRALGTDPRLRDRLVRIPTGFGKTAGVVVAWLYNRLERKDTDWPTRLVLALPMRVLVEQTHREIHKWRQAAGLVEEQLGIHILMGGVDAGAFHFHPERPAILIGTQDMLLSRALNRGYGAARGRWPVDFGLVHTDALWVLDEVQLMDVGLATSAQLAAFRRAHSARNLRSSATWWMSATLQPRWLATVDQAAALPALEGDLLAMPSTARAGGLWECHKALAREPALGTPAEVAAVAWRDHRPGTLTLLVLNTVDRAVEAFTALDKQLANAAKARRSDPASAEASADPDLRLVHGRFRGHEREAWAKAFLSRDPAIPCPPGGRIIVATQVVEAGVDISARLLVTDLAPWPSLVQRFGRAARYTGESGRVVVVGPVPADAKKALPYDAAELAAADEAIGRLGAEDAGAGLRALEMLEERLAAEDPELLARLYPYDPLHVLREVDVDDLFDTSPDLSGADLDVSRFIRSGDERDVALFWRAIEGEPRAIEAGKLGRPRRTELCPAPIGATRKWLEGADRKKRAWVFSYLEDQWLRLDRDGARLYPGVQVLVAAGAGGYHPERGFDPKARPPAPVVPEQPLTTAEKWSDRAERTSAGEEEDLLSAAGWKTIATHCGETGSEAAAIARALALPAPLAKALQVAGWWHDLGKSHEAFQAAIGEEARAKAGARGDRRDLAKAPEPAWRRPAYPDRPGFRHELASFLALYEHVRRDLGGALLGVDDGGAPLERAGLHPAVQALADGAAGDPGWIDLVAWLVLTHHGKVRCRLTGTPSDQKPVKGVRRPRLHGVCAEDPMPPIAFPDSDPSAAPVLPGVTLSLELAALGLSDRFGPSWTERVARLVERHGPFTLAFLEAILRAADVRASRLATEDSLL